METELIEKEIVLKENIKDIAQLDEVILLIGEQYSDLLAERKKIEDFSAKEAKVQENIISSWNSMDINSNPDNGSAEDSRKKSENIDSENTPEIQHGKRVSSNNT